MSKQDLLHPSQSTRSVANTLWCAAASALAMQLTACTHTLVFSDTSPIEIRGNPPAPKPAEKIVVKPVVEAPPAPKLVEVTQDQIVIHEKIQFETSKAAIKPESGPLLEEITSVIQQNPQLQRLSIEGHTDSTGADKLNQALSEQRASAVRDYLVEHGIAADRLSSRGWGKSRPIGDNSTATGREANRRVEFVIVEQTVSSAGPEKPSAPLPVEGAP